MHHCLVYNHTEGSVNALCTWTAPCVQWGHIHLYMFMCVCLTCILTQIQTMWMFGVYAQALSTPLSVFKLLRWINSLWMKIPVYLEWQGLLIPITYCWIILNLGHQIFMDCQGFTISLKCNYMDMFSIHL